jgi:hypothetical protein
VAAEEEAVALAAVAAARVVLYSEEDREECPVVALTGATV